MASIDLILSLYLVNVLVFKQYVKSTTESLRKAPKIRNFHIYMHFWFHNRIIDKSNRDYVNNWFIYFFSIFFVIKIIFDEKNFEKMMASIKKKCFKTQWLIRITNFLPNSKLYKSEKNTNNISLTKLVIFIFITWLEGNKTGFVRMIWGVLEESLKVYETIGSLNWTPTVMWVACISPTNFLNW
jgi:hypothetical protein